mmetsp:Transcript_24547/g.61005  ORF Transcript_24547/g.61005 Transcript_24547/m.61005 type:complete len:454 (-) Transcript_24547:122-1483(-)
MPGASSGERGSARGGAVDEGEICGSPSRSTPSRSAGEGGSPSQRRALSQPDAEAVARKLVAELRQQNPGLQGRAVVNDELAVAFVQRYFRMVAELGPERAQPRVVFHGTAASNFDAIIAGNLRVPDGAKVLSASGRSTYGFGIYVSTSFDIALMYGRKHDNGAALAKAEAAAKAGAIATAALAADAGGAQPAAAEAAAAAQLADAHEARAPAGMVFVCLSLPGRQHVSVPPQDTACRAARFNSDSHVSADRGGQISVYFDSAQLLPCFLSTRDSLICAQEAAVRAVDALLKATPERAHGDDSSNGAGDAGSCNTAEDAAFAPPREVGESGGAGLQPQSVPAPIVIELDTKSVQCFAPTEKPPPASLLAATSAFIRNSVAPAIAVVAGVTGISAVVTNGRTAVSSALPLPPFPGAPVETQAMAAATAAAEARRTRAPEFQTAEWDGVQKRMRYS